MKKFIHGQKQLQKLSSHINNFYKSIFKNPNNIRKLKKDMNKEFLEKELQMVFIY